MNMNLADILSSNDVISLQEYLKQGGNQFIPYKPDGELSKDENGNLLYDAENVPIIIGINTETTEDGIILIKQHALLFLRSIEDEDIDDRVNEILPYIYIVQDSMVGINSLDNIWDTYTRSDKLGAANILIDTYPINIDTNNLGDYSPSYVNELFMKGLVSNKDNYNLIVMAVASNDADLIASVLTDPTLPEDLSDIYDLHYLVMSINTNTVTAESILSRMSFIMFNAILFGIQEESYNNVNVALELNLIDDPSDYEILLRDFILNFNGDMDDTKELLLSYLIHGSNFTYGLDVVPAGNIAQALLDARFNVDYEPIEPYGDANLEIEDYPGYIEDHIIG